MWNSTCQVGDGENHSCGVQRGEWWVGKVVEDPFVDHTVSFRAVGSVNQGHPALEVDSDYTCPPKAWKHSRGILIGIHLTLNYVGSVEAQLDTRKDFSEGKILSIPNGDDFTIPWLRFGERQGSRRETELAGP